MRSLVKIDFRYHSCSIGCGHRPSQREYYHEKHVPQVQLAHIHGAPHLTSPLAFSADTAAFSQLYYNSWRPPVAFPVATCSATFVPATFLSACGFPSGFAFAAPPATLGGSHGSGIGLFGSIGGRLMVPTLWYFACLAKNFFQLVRAPSSCSERPRRSWVRWVWKQPVMNAREASRPAL